MEHTARVLFIRGLEYQNMMGHYLYQLCITSIHIKYEYHDIADTVYYDVE